MTARSLVISRLISTCSLLVAMPRWSPARATNYTSGCRWNIVTRTSCRRGLILAGRVVPNSYPNQDLARASFGVTLSGWGSPPFLRRRSAPLAPPPMRLMADGVCAAHYHALGSQKKAPMNFLVAPKILQPIGRELHNGRCAECFCAPSRPGWPGAPKY